MGLVDYDSDSGSSSDGKAAPTAKPATATTTAAAGGKKPFQKLVDRANPGKILISLPSAGADASGGADDEDDAARPAKRARVGGGGSSRFSGFGSFLPPPKKTAAAATTTTATATTTATTATTQDAAGPRSSARPGVSLKTSGEAAFRRADGDGLPTTGGAASPSRPAPGGLALPPPKAPSVAAGQKAAEDVKLVGNPLMFMPLSVSRRPGKKTKTKAQAGAVPTAAEAPKPGASAGVSASTSADKAAAAPPAKKKVSLFSLDADDQADVAQAVAAADDDNGPSYDQATYDQAAYDQAAYGQPAYEYASTYGHEQQQQQQQQQEQQTGQLPQDDATLEGLADSLHLSAKERRELFGRRGAATAQIAASFNMDAEYRHNEALRQAGEAEQQQSHQPVRTLMPGKHSLRQLVNAVVTQKDALEENFVKNRAAQRDSGGKYGWR